MSLFDKFKWVLSILLVFVIVLTTNLIDKDNFKRLRNSIATIYEDRLIASDLIFEMSSLIQKKQMALITSDSVFITEQNSKINKDIRGIIEKYEQTKITPEERTSFDSFKNHFENLTNQEVEYINTGFASNKDLLNSINGLNNDLYNLSKVQLKEGKKQMSFSQKTMDTIELFTQVEIIFLVAMAILIQVIILYKPKKS
ncbi:MCP four helix bundle domain-containing protein [Fulvivirga lutimaris]|uniref:MCP four helix bundle domain-containing protein n=1 Tax=Fulvivirga lutimaris TaxID=1819566 RepID=UPI0012BB609E|nr:MCP four helix bundle domain-containing protein [Fulvivirga lutimaris]MTI38944.1 chemotaxis protein [Fulvivirga lutimaris]